MKASATDPSRHSSSGVPGTRAAARDPLLWGALLLQLCLSLPGLTSRTVWLDEAYTAVISRRGFAAIAASLAHDSGPPLHYWVIAVWRQVFGESPASLRAPSVLFTLAGCVALYVLAARVSNRKTARIGALLWATSPVAVFYSGEARAYALLAFLALTLTRIVIEPEEGWRWHRFILISIAALALLYTHNVAWFAGAAMLGALALVRRRATLRPILLAGLAVALAGYAAWIPTLRAQTGNVAWVRQVWSSWSPLWSLSAWAPLGWVPGYIGVLQPPTWIWVPCVLLWYVPAALAVIWAWRGRQPDIVFLAAYVLLGLAIPWALSLAWQPLWLAGRHDFFLLGPVILLVAAGVSRLRPWLAASVTAAFIIAGATSVVLSSRTPPPIDERPWTSLIAKHGRPGDVIVCTGVTRPVAEYYLAGRGFQFLSYPAQMELDLAHLDEDWYAAHVDLEAEAARVASGAIARIGAGNQLWVLMSPGRINEPLYGAVDGLGLANTVDLHDPRMGLRRLNQWVRVAAFVRRQPE